MQKRDHPGQGDNSESPGSYDAWELRCRDSQMEARRADRIAMDRVDGCGIEACGLGRRPFDHDSVTEAGHDQPIRSGISDRRGRARARRTRRRRWWQVAQFRSARVLRGRFVMKSQLSIIAALSASLLMTAGCKQDTHVSEPVRPVLSIIVEPTPSGDPVFVGAVEPRFKTDLAFRVLGRLIARSRKSRRYGYRRTDCRCHRSTAVGARSSVGKSRARATRRLGSRRRARRSSESAC